MNRPLASSCSCWLERSTRRRTSAHNGAELATYVVEKGKPLITLVK